MSQSIFKIINCPNHATSNHWNRKSINTNRYFIFILCFDFAKGEASAPLAPPLFAPLLACTW